MTNNQKSLLKLIRESADPTQAILVAIEIISDYLRQPESLKAQVPVGLVELD